METDYLALYLVVMIIFGISAGIITVTVFWFYRRSESLFAKWIEENDYQVLEKKMQWLNQGPLFWSSSSGQTIYRVTLSSRQDGRVYQGWLRCGSYWKGLFSNQVEVHWDDESC